MADGNNGGPGRMEIRVPGWFLLAFIFVSGSLQVAVEILPAGTAWQVAKILYGGVMLLGTSVAMLSSGRRR